MVEKRKIGLVLTLFRRNSTPSFCAMIPQVLHTNKSPLLLNDPIHRKKTLKRMNLVAFTSFHSHLLMTSGVHQLKRLPKVCMLHHLFSLKPKSHKASNQLMEAAESWISKLSLKKDSGYPVDSNPNPGNTSLPIPSHISNYPNSALEYHNLQLEAAAFREEFDPETFEDLTLPNYKAMHKVVLTMLVAGVN